MNSINEYAPFRETAELLSDLTNERDALNIEQGELWKQLSYSNPNQGGENLTTEEAARRMANGGAPPASNGERIRAAAARELAVRTRLEALNRVLKDLPGVLEAHRRKGRDVAIGDLAGDVEAIKRDFEAARQAMLAAILAENHLHERLVLGGFGSTDPWITAPHWLNRNLLIESGHE